MIPIEPIEFPGTEHIVQNIEFYKNKFISDSVIAFRNANLTKDEGFKFSQEFCKAIGVYVHEKDKYVENHARRPNMISTGPDEILVEWHVEHTYYPNPIIAAIWNMYNFNTDTENGKTYFVDTGLIFDMLSDSEKEFLVNCNITEEESIKKQLMTQSKISDNYPIISKHWITEKPIIRFTMLPGERYPVLVSFNGGTPKDTEIEQFELIMSKIIKTIRENEDIRLVHKWQQGDIVIPDLFKLAHAVTGGFTPDNREFIGIWVHKYNGGAEIA